MNRRVLRTEDAARYLGLSRSTLEKLRVRGEGPSFVKLGSRAVGYDVGDLDKWIEDRRTAKTVTTSRARRG